MILKSNALLGLPVFTKNEMRVGRIAGFEFEAESQTVLRYEIRRSLIQSSILIHRSQVVSIDATRMIVEDASLPEQVRVKLARRGAVAETPAPIQSSVEE